MPAERSGAAPVLTAGTHGPLRVCPGDDDWFAVDLSAETVSRTAPGLWAEGGKLNLERALKVGDAAHAVVPFFGQGMNCGFEDAEVLERHLDASGDAWAPAIAAYAAARREDVDALADLSLEHYAHLSHVPDQIGRAHV